jgi:hypothetical protein
LYGAPAKDWAPVYERLYWNAYSAPENTIVTAFMGTRITAPTAEKGLTSRTEILMAGSSSFGMGASEGACETAESPFRMALRSALAVARRKAVW